MLFSYKAINEQGRLCKGRLDAASEVDLEIRLKRMQLALVSANRASRFSLLAGKKVRRTDLISLFFNLEQLARSGIPLLESLADLRNSMDSHQLRSVLADMIAAIEGGKKLSQVMACHPQVFDNIVVSLIVAGEESGRLAEIFKHLAESTKWQDEMSLQSRNLMLYPAFVGITVLGITVFLMIYLVPQLTTFISNMGQTIPFQTRLLLSLSDLLVHYWHVILALPIVVVILLKQALAWNSRLQYRMDQLKLDFIIVGPILHKIIMARFANTFAMMYGSGISILDCIASLKGLVNNRVIAASLDQVISEIGAGKNMTQSFLDTGVFPPLVVRMINVGETTGRLDEALYNVSYFFDRDVKDAIRKTQILIEPVMTIVLGMLLGWVMLSVLSPVYDIIGRIKT